MLKTGNTLPRVQLEDVLVLPVPVPSLPVQERIASKVSVIRAEVRKLKKINVKHLLMRLRCELMRELLG